MVHVDERECVIGSQSQLKMMGARQACQRFAFPTRFFGVMARSGIEDQPIGFARMEEGARNRIASAKALMPHMQLYFAAESGLVDIAGRWYDVVCGAVHNARSKEVSEVSIAFSSTFPIPTWVVELTFNTGSELGEVVKKLSGNTLTEKDAVAYFTRYKLTRMGQIAQAFHYALPPILFGDLYEKGE